MIEHIIWNSRTLACIIRADASPEKTTFLTPSDFNLQVGFVVHPSGEEIAPHVHRPLERHVVGTSEVLVVQNGRCQIDIYNDQREQVASRVLKTGDILVMVGGGHGFRMLENTVLLEVKQGPYGGLDEKERF